MNKLFTLFFAILITVLVGCGEKDGQPACNPPVISVKNTTNTACGESIGSFSVKATEGVGAVQYSLDGKTFQSSGDFAGLHAGSYTVSAKDEQGCTATIYVSVVSGMSY